MEQREKIIKLLNEFREDDSKIIELEALDKVGMNIIDIIFEKKMYDILLKLFYPFTFNQNGEVLTKVFFDPFSLSDLVYKIEHSYSSEEEALEQATKIYEKNSKCIDEVYDEDLIFLLSRPVEVILEEMLVIPQRNQILEKIYDLDLEKIDKIKIKNSHARSVSGINNPIYTEKDVIFYAEPACLRACLDLFRKNIKTIANDTAGVIEDCNYSGDAICRIDIDFCSLDDENKKIVQQLIAEGKAEKTFMYDIEVVSIIYTCDREETIGFLSRKMLEIASRLVYQDILYGRKLIEEIGEETSNSEFNVHDDVEDIYWEHISYLERHRKYLLYKQENSLNNKRKK